MKKVCAGFWISEDEKYYTYKDDLGFWSVGMIINGERQHLEDFKLMREARIFIAEHQNKKEEK